MRQPDIDEATRKKALSTIERNGRAQAALIEDLLDMSRATTGKLKVVRTSTDLGLLLRRLVKPVEMRTLIEAVADAADVGSLQKA